MSKKFRKHSCEFKNESVCEEELDEGMEDFEEEEAEEFGE